MTRLVVNGGRGLRGRITPSANKNAVLPVLCATLLTDQPVTLHRVPDITDVRKILDFFRSLGSTVDMDFEAGVLKVRHGEGLDPKAACTVKMTPADDESKSKSPKSNKSSSSLVSSKSDIVRCSVR